MRWLALPILLVAVQHQAPKLIPHLASSASEWAEELYLQVTHWAQHAVVTTAGVNLQPEPDMEKPSQGAPEDSLKLPLARDEREIDAQQRLSARRYAEAARQREPDILPLEQPDEIRRSMPPLDRSGPEMRCGAALPPESRLVTRNIELYTRSVFEGSYGEQYAWKYFVTFTNRGEETVQMLTRHWVFVDALGRLSAEVMGPGARGVTPVLPPGGEWTYESGTSLNTPFGSMHGSFQFEILRGRGRSFGARVARLALSDSARAQQVPCIDEAQEGMLPLTSVLAVERVILGGHSKFTLRKDGKYYFAYDVQFNNARDTEIEVVGHLWEVVDAQGQRHVVAEGDGVGGRFRGASRALAPGDAFRSQGQVFAATALGNAQGTYRVLIHEQGQKIEIEARTDFMGLSADKDVSHVPNFVADPDFR